MRAQIPVVLDRVQLRRIESTHRGFLYQHLFAVGCLLLAQNGGVTSVSVETDEDIELQLSDQRVYIQVKTRSNGLNLSDISGSLNRFDDLRKQHTTGERKLTPQFIVVSNIAPGPELAEHLVSSKWQSDVLVLWPEHLEFSDLSYVPPAWSNLNSAVQWCIDYAGSVPFSLLSSETLVWKLAALVQLASTGAPPYESHQFLTEQLPELFEQIAIQLHHFPSPPNPYRPQGSEPDFQSEEKVRLIVGLSGAGKTAWASQAAMHSGSEWAYFDAGDTAGPALASSLARELVGRYFKEDRKGLGSVILPGSSGLDSLRAVGRSLFERSINVKLVIDNVQSLLPSELEQIIRSTPDIQYLLLARQWPQQAELEAVTGVEPEPLGGWSIETVGEVFAEAECIIDPHTSSRILRLTGGLPLYVQSAARLTKKLYDGDSGAFATDLEAGAHPTRTAQEIILARVFETLAPEVVEAVAIIGISDVPLTREESDELIKESLSIGHKSIGQIIRAAHSVGIIQLHQDGKLLLHDAFRPNVSDFLSNMDGAIVQKAHSKLRDLMESSIRSEHNIDRVSLFVRLLPVTGEFATLVDLATDEFFWEMGLLPVVASTLENVASSEDLAPRDRFQALNALASMFYQRDNFNDYVRRLEQMEGLLQEIEDGDDEKTTLLMRQMVKSGIEGDVSKIEQLFSEAIDCNSGDEHVIRILRYTFALSLYYAGDYKAVEREAWRLILEYYDLLGLEIQDVFAKNPPEIQKKLTDIPTQRDDLKHLADSLHLYANAREHQGERSGLARLHAIKFYDMAGAVRSIVSFGRDVVDEQIGILRDPISARMMLESALLPAMQRYKLLDYLIPVRAQYAVVLAYCAEFDAADAEMNRLEPFAESLTDFERAEFENQRRLIDDIKAGRVKLDTKDAFQPALVERSSGSRRRRKIGRNERCPCGSGKKYKKCHGR